MGSITYNRSEHARLYDKYVQVFEIADKYAYQIIDGRKVMPNKERQVHIKDIEATESYEFLAKLDLINYLKKHFAYLF